MAELGTIQQTLLALLEDGKWHSLRELYYAVETFIRPEVAMRMYNEKPKVKELPLEEQIELGKRAVLTTYLSRLGVERRGSGMTWEREYRYAPQKSKRTEHGATDIKLKYGLEAIRAICSIPVVGAVIRVLKDEPYLEARLSPMQLYWLKAYLDHPTAELPEPAKPEEIDSDMVTS